MTDSEILETLTNWIIEQLGESKKTHRQLALEAYQQGNDRVVKILSLRHIDDRYIDCLSFLCGVRRLKDSNPVTAYTTIKEAFKAMREVRQEELGIQIELRFPVDILRTNS